MSKVGFVWQGINGVYGRWDDGLKAAMKLVEKEHEVHYFEPSADFTGMDILLYWEAPCTAGGKDRDNYEKVRETDIPKILLFAGGPIKHEWCTGFDMFLVESAVNEQEFEDLGFKWKRAFGVNTLKMKPEAQPKVWDACFPSTCAGWKRQGLFSRALREKGVICGRGQNEDPGQFLMARENNTMLFPELPYEAVNSIYNASHCCVNTSDYWGGGQRTTLEAMAAGIPVIVMKDSTKNREYVEESGAGIVVDPSEENIRKAIEEIKSWTPEEKSRGIAYVHSKWTHEHYAKNILEAIHDCIGNNS